VMIAGRVDNRDLCSNTLVPSLLDSRSRHGARRREGTSEAHHLLNPGLQLPQ
jgi:hypothetical protein